jgi:hypothetical protein
MLIEIQCDTRDFDKKMKSVSDFYRKLSNGKNSLGGPHQTNRRWWSRCINGGNYYYRKNESQTEILFNLELKTDNLLGVKIQFLSRIKKLLPFSIVRFGGDELMENLTERFTIKEQGCIKGTQFIGTHYKSPNRWILDSNN